MLKRKIDSYLEHYFATTDKALLVTGARQVGITYAPVYMAMFLVRENDAPLHYEIDISMLR